MLQIRKACIRHWSSFTRNILTSRRTVSSLCLIRKQTWNAESNKFHMTSINLRVQYFASTVHVVLSFQRKNPIQLRKYAMWYNWVKKWNSNSYVFKVINFMNAPSNLLVRYDDCLQFWGQVVSHQVMDK